ncbi:DUF3857 domain-containing protein [Fulvivirga lutea]|uniref:DUF3857 domain-containing protein n=1 Tax=Fulvivirga lutea TaxID=2810512 RepID=A0A974WF48_9BACT|nr:DUF3857 domain-containing protein [Fulvivirga lutea]QSE95852.1 DUF3857 domain-containing protein [Fulvivirga lutea]
MIKSYLKRQTKSTLILLGLIIYSTTSFATDNFNSEKAKEIKSKMWDNPSKDFTITEIPEKWNNESAVYIAKTHDLSYRKAPIINELYYDKSFHHRIKLLDKSAVEKYSEFSFAESGYYGDMKIDIYPGFKIIKPNGEEIEVSIENAVKQKLEIERQGYNTYKLAIPNLEIGDIVDFYIAEERTIRIYTKLYNFDAIIFQLNDEYPILKQKISFDVLRRCFINLKSTNGAPEFQLTQDYKGDKNQYTLVDENRESIKELRWFYPNRQLPTVKFKVSYASSMMASVSPTFLGEPGQLKSNVSKAELEKLIKYIFERTSYKGAELKKYMKSHYKKTRDLNVLARKGYYAYRNMNEVKFAEYRMLSENSTNQDLTVTDANNLSYYYRSKNIPHEILIGVPRSISTIDELILENELTVMMKVNTSSPFYISDCSEISNLGMITPDLQNTEVYSFNATKNVSDWFATKTMVPAEKSEQNLTYTESIVELENLEEDKLILNVTKEINGNPKPFFQRNLMDVYDYLADERKTYEMDDFIESLARSSRKELYAKKSAYMDNRMKNIYDVLLNMTKNDYQFEIKEVTDLSIQQTGRKENEDKFIYTFKIEANDAVKKVGQNYLIDIGKLIEGQVNLSDDELDREYDVYQPYARKFKYDIKMKIPEGYELQGFDELNFNVDNETGSFRSFASIDNNELIIRTIKDYKSNFVKKEDWPLTVEFLKAAYKFTQQKVLLRKI